MSCIQPVLDGGQKGWSVALKLDELQVSPASGGAETPADFSPGAATVVPAVKGACPARDAGR